VAFLTSAPISKLAIELLTRSLVLVNTVARVPGDEYGGPSGGTVTIRVPQPRTANEQSTPSATITLVDQDEWPVDVTLSHIYDGIRVSDEDLSLKIEDFGRQVLRPQVAAVATAAENKLATAMNALTVDPVIEFAATASESDTRDVILAIREQMTDNDVPAGDRWVACAPDIVTRLLNIPELVRVDQSGSRTALRDAIVGRAYGLNFVESNAITDGTAVGYHSSGFGFGNRAPTSNTAGADSSTETENGVTLRHTLAFDATRLATISVVSTFAGAAAVPDSDPDESGDPEYPRVIRVGTGS
jgi:hypothetical protein